MKLIAQVKLLPTPDQARALTRTLEQANAAANQLSEVAWTQQVFGQYSLHKLAYAHLRQHTGLTAQVVVRVISKVADAYKLDRKTKRTFRPHGSIAYDDRILKYQATEVSIWTVVGRQRIAFTCGDRQRELLASRQGESDLVYRQGQWYLLATVNVEEPPADETGEFLGVDLGIVNLATDSDGVAYSGESVERHRRIYAHRRRNLQKKRTKAATRKLRHLSGRQANYQRTTNHQIARALVRAAQGTGRGVALEDLKGLRARVSVRGRKERARHGNWSYKQIGTFVRYKVALAGVRVVEVDPRHTSQRCHRCGHTERANRQSQSSFLCRSCGRSFPADHNVAMNLAFLARAAVNPPMVSLPCAAGTSLAL
jgi:IS605 OrfB family transposase